MIIPNTKAITLTSLAAGLLAAVPLCAEDEIRTRFGVETSFATPVGNTHKAASTSFGVGMFLERELEVVTKRGNVERGSFGLSIDYVSLGQKKWERDFIPDTEIATSVENLNFQLYMRPPIFLSGESGFYFTLGIGCGYATIENSSGANSRSFAPMGTVGIDYSFGRNVGLIARFTGTADRHYRHYLDKNLLRGKNLEYLQFGAQYRF